VLTIATQDNISQSVDDANTAALIAASRELTLGLGGSWNACAPPTRKGRARAKARAQSGRKLGRTKPRA
jgi:hypothetical protein